MPATKKPRRKIVSIEAETTLSNKALKTFITDAIRCWRNQLVAAGAPLTGFEVVQLGVNDVERPPSTPA